MTQAPSSTALPSGTTGAATQKPTLTDAKIQQSLEQEGFSNLMVQHKGGGHADVTAMKGGRTQRLDVDPTTGKTTAETD
jgi:hypothetical protein